MASGLVFTGIQFDVGKVDEDGELEVRVSTFAGEPLFVMFLDLGDAEDLARGIHDALLNFDTPPPPLRPVA